MWCGSHKKLYTEDEPPRDKTNKMVCAPAKTQISMGIRQVWSESSLCAQWVAKDPSFLHADSEDSTPTADAQADLILRWAHKTLCWFCHDVQLNRKVETCLIWLTTTALLDKIRQRPTSNTNNIVCHKQYPNFITMIKPLARAYCHMSQLMRLWYFSSSINSFFKCTCAAIQWD